MAFARGCSIIIPAFNRASLTRHCLDVLLRAPQLDEAVEIIVVDDASTDITPRLLESYGNRIRTVTHSINAGFSTSCNDGAAIANYGYLVFLNNDTIPHRNWLAHLVQFADEHPDAAAVGSKLLYPNGTIQHAGVAFDRNRWPFCIYRGFPADHPAVNKSRRYRAVGAASMLVRHELFESVGGFDRVFINGVEDIDLCLRLEKLGYAVYYCHSSTLTHLESMTRGVRGEVPSRLWQLADDANFRMFMSRWSSSTSTDEHLYYVQDGLLWFSNVIGESTRIHVAPELGVIAEDDDTARRESDRLIVRLTQQVSGLLSENIRLKAIVDDAELQVVARARLDCGLPPVRMHALVARCTAPEMRAFIARCFFDGVGVQVHSGGGMLEYPPHVEVRPVCVTYETWRLQASRPVGHGDVPLSAIEDSSQDFAACVGVQQPDDVARAIAAMLRVLRPGGVVYLTCAAAPAQLAAGRTCQFVQSEQPMSQVLASLQRASVPAEIVLALQRPEELHLVVRKPRTA